MDNEALVREFPLEIVRACCYGKSCGNVTLSLSIDAQLTADNDAVVVAGYKRDNGDWYYGPFQDAEQLKQVVNREYKLNEEDEE